MNPTHVAIAVVFTVVALCVFAVAYCWGWKDASATFARRPYRSEWDPVLHTFRRVRLVSRAGALVVQISSRPGSFRDARPADVRHGSLWIPYMEPDIVNESRSLPASGHRPTVDGDAPRITKEPKS